MRFSIKSKGVLAVFLALIFLAAVGTTAFFADRTAHQMTFTTATFTQDGYSLSRTVANGPFIAGEDVSFKLKETNSKSEDITSIVTMMVSWASPDTSTNIFSGTEKAVITIGGNRYDYTPNSDGTITLIVNEHVLRAGSAVETPIVIHIPDTLKSTGDIKVSFEKVHTGQHPSGFTCEYDRAELNAAEDLDFTARVGWAAAKTTLSVSTEKALMAFLSDPDQDGKYDIAFEFAFNYTSSDMKDFSSAADAKWSAYKSNVTGLSFCEGMTSVGDYAFSGFTGIPSVTIPSTVTNIGTSAFDGSGLQGEIIIPKAVTSIESLAFGNLPKVTTFTFKHGVNDSLTLPNNTASGSTAKGAFYVPSFVKTTINTENEKINYDYNWHNDNRRAVPVLATQDTWFEQGKSGTDKTKISQISIVDHYTPASYKAKWDASDGQRGSVTAYLEDDGTGKGTNKLTIAGNGYGRIFAHKDSSYAFSASGNYGWVFYDNLTAIHGADLLDMSNATAMVGMFANCTNLVTVDVSNWNVSNVVEASTSHFGTFADCSSLKTLDVSKWDVRNMQDMSSMFSGCSSLSTLPVSNWKTESATYFDYMFQGIGMSSLDLSSWITTHVLGMDGMFRYSTALKTVDLSGLTNPVLKDIAYMFDTCTNLESVDLTGFLTPNVTEMQFMFSGCSNLKAIDVSSFSTSKTTNMAGMFNRCTSLKNLNVSSFDTRAVVRADASGLYRFAYHCTALTDITLGANFGQANTIPSAGSNNGMFYVPSYLKTTINGANTVMKVNAYDWITDNRWKVGIASATLAYDDVLVGETVDPQLELLPVNYDDYQSIQYEVISGGQYAEVDKNTGVVKGLEKGTATIRVTIVDANGETIIADGTVNVYYIGITDATLTYDDVRVGETVDPQLDLLPDDHDDDQSRKYEVISGGQYAKVDEDTGVVTGLKPGEATIRVTIIDANGDKITAEATVTVYAIGITKATLKYDDVQVDKTVNPQLEVLPTDRDTDKSKTYSIIAGGEYAKVDPSTGVVTGLKPGTATVRVTIVDANGKTVSADATVRVYSIGVTSATLAYDDVLVGDTVNPQQTILPADRYPDKSITYAIISGGSYATIDPATGVVTGVAPGNATVRMTIVDAAGKTTTADATVKVYAIGITSATLAYSSVNVGETVDPSLTVLPADRNPDKSKTFSIVSGGAYAKVDADTGVVTGLAEGTARVRVTIIDANGVTVTAEANVKVIHPIPELAYEGNWYTQGGTTIDKSSITSISFVDKIDSATKSAAGSNYWDASYGKEKTVYAYAVLNSDNSTYSLTIAGNGYGSIYANTYSSEAFADFTNLTSFNNIRLLDTGNTLTMVRMFGNLKKLTNLDISHFDTQNVTDMSYFFNACEQLSTVNISTKSVTMNGRTYDSWDTGNVTSMDGMFLYVPALTALDVSHFDTQNVKDFNLMFMNARSLSDLNISTKSTTLNGRTFNSWDTGTGTNFNSMFTYNKAAISFDLSHFDTSSATDISNMFDGCVKLTTVKTTPKSITLNGRTFTSWDTGNVRTVGYMFYDCESLISVDISKWDLSSVTTSGSMFQNCKTLKSLTIPGTLVKFGNKFAYKCLALTEINFLHTVGTSISFPAAGATNGAFYVPSYLKTTFSFNGNSNARHYDWVTDNRALDLPIPTLAKWYTWFNPTNSDISRFDVSSLEIVDSFDPTGKTFVETWDGSEAQDGSIMVYAQDDGLNAGTYKIILSGNGSGCIYTNADSYGAFWNMINCTEITGMSLLDTSKTTNMEYMFNALSKVTELDVGHFDTSNVTSMRGLFDGCESIKTFDVANWDTGKVTNMMQTFELCIGMTNPNVGTWDTQNVENMYNMFFNCQSLKSIDLSTQRVTRNGRTYDSWDTGNVTYIEGFLKKCYGLETVDVSTFDTSSFENSRLMFAYSTEIQAIDVSDKTITLNGRTVTTWDMSNNTDLYGMFMETGITSIDVTAWDTSKVEDFQDMFAITKLTSLDVSSFDTSGTTYYYSLNGFAADCPDLTTIIFGPNFGQEGMVGNAGSIGGLFYVDGYSSTNPLQTTIINANDVMLSYDWLTDNRDIGLASSSSVDLLYMHMPSQTDTPTPDFSLPSFAPGLENALPDSVTVSPPNNTVTESIPDIKPEENEEMENTTQDTNETLVAPEDDSTSEEKESTTGDTNETPVDPEDNSTSDEKESVPENTNEIPVVPEENSTSTEVHDTSVPALEDPLALSETVSDTGISDATVSNTDISDSTDIVSAPENISEVNNPAA